MRCFFVILLSFLILPLFAQAQHDWEKYFVDLVDVEDMGEDALSDMYEKLCELEENPLNINTASFDEFVEIPCFSIAQISDIIEYRDRYGELKSMEELAMIPSVDRTLRLFLSSFMVAEKMEAKKWYSKEGLRALPARHKATLLSSVDVPFYTRKGYEISDKTGEKAYLGDKYRYNLRYTGKFGNDIKYGFVTAKDAGEPVFSHGNTDGMDYYSYFVNLNNVGRIKQIFIGNFRARFGMGLVLNTNSSYGKQTMLSSIATVSNMLTGHISRSDATYLRGAAATVALGKAGNANILDFTAFYSLRNLDATLNDDGSVSSILSSGYHRTESEMNKKHNTKQMATGAHLAWKNGGWHAGLTAVYDWFNRDLNPSWSTDGYKYRKYSARGNTFWNAGIDYGYLSSRFSFTGESATGGCGAFATLNTLQFAVNDALTLTAIQRFYSYQYYAIQSNAFSDGGKVQNESGLYLGARWNLGRHLTLDGYSDLSYSPWLKYQVHASSYSWDNNLNLIYRRGKWNALCRYRMRMKQRDNSDKTALFNRNEHRGRVMVEHVSNHLSFKTQFDVTSVALENDNSFGWMLGETARYVFGNKFDFSLGTSYFHTDGYDSRIYSYERSILYSFAMSSCYGEGMRFFLVGRADIGRDWMLIAKLGLTKYFDRDVIGTAHQQIDSPRQVDLSVQLRYKF